MKKKERKHSWSRVPEDEWKIKREINGTASKRRQKQRTVSKSLVQIFMKLRQVFPEGSNKGTNID